jgi:hypothetical protein
MPPWDRLASFRIPVETTYSLTGTPLMIAKGDPMRVLLVFALTGTVISQTTVIFPIPIAFGVQNISVNLPAAMVSTDPTLTNQKGFAVTPIGYPFIIDAKQWGPAVAAPWYAVAQGTPAPQLTVMSVTMAKWPEATTQDSLIKEVDDGKYRELYERRTYRVRPAKLYGNSWTQRQALPPYGIPVFDESGVRQ